MKKLLIVLITAISGHMTYAAEYDFLKGYDFTGASSVTGTKLNQLVDSATLVGNKAILIYTNATPDTTNNARFTRYIWMNTNFDPPQPYVYKTNGGVWTNISAVATIGANTVAAGALQANSVNTSNIVDNAITDVKIIAGAVTSSKIANGSISNNHIAALTIQGTNIANGQILSTNIAAAAILGYHMAQGQIGLGNLTNGFLLPGTNIAAGTITSNNIASGGVVLTNINSTGIGAMQVIRMNSAATALEWATPVYTNSSTGTSGSTLPANATAVQTIAHTLGARPTGLRVVIICNDAAGDAGYAQNDEIEANTVYNGSGETPWNIAVDASNVIIAYDDVFTDNGTLRVCHKTTGAITTITQARWNFKSYVRK